MAKTNRNRDKRDAFEVATRTVQRVERRISRRETRWQAEALHPALTRAHYLEVAPTPFKITSHASDRIRAQLAAPIAQAGRGGIIMPRRNLAAGPSRPLLAVKPVQAPTLPPNRSNKGTLSANRVEQAERFHDSARPATCKERPDNTKKTGNGGQTRAFVPWCRKS